MEIPDQYPPELPDDWTFEPLAPEPDDHTAPPAAVAAAAVGGATGIRGIRARLRRRRDQPPVPAPVPAPDTASAAERSALIESCVDLDDLLTDAVHREKLRRGLRAVGVEVVDPTGERFDPERHCAVGTEVPADAAQDRHIARVERVGWSDRGAEVRAPEVIVYKVGS